MRRTRISEPRDIYELLERHQANQRWLNSMIAAAHYALGDINPYKDKSYETLLREHLRDEDL